MANPIGPYSLLFPIAAKILEILGSPLSQGVNLAWNMKDDLKKLRNTITFVHAVLLDAGVKQYQDGNNHQLKVWMGELRIALYEADDLLDDLLIHSLRQQSPHQSLMGKVRTSISNPLVFRPKTILKIKKLRKKFDAIAADRNKFGLIEGIVERNLVIAREPTHSFVDESGVIRPKTILKIKKLREKFDAIAADRNKFGLIEGIVERNLVIAREPTHSFVDESGVIGRGVFKEAIIGSCLNTTLPPFISIIGLGGIGKTTLAQTVYQDKRVIDNFDLRIWVCISDTFDLAKIILDILKSIDSATEYANYMHLRIVQLQLLLRQKLQGKKYLLVLDDVWNEERDKWIELMNLLTADGVEAGSKVIVTARSELVSAALAPRTCLYRLEALTDDDCLSVLLTWAFAEREEANRFPRLVDIGREIVQKCKGNPLAVRTLGKLLYMKTEERDWVYVRDNDVWDSGQGEGDIMPALKLSYHQLPSHLKQCFAYFSLFPKDFVFNEICAVEFWRAHGLIRSEQFKTLEATGKEYMDLLAARGFFQKYRVMMFSEVYKMHDLVHDLAQSVAKPYCISTTSYHLLSSTIKVQHLSFMENGPQGDDRTGDLVLSELLELQPQLRSFLLFDGTPPSHSRLNSFIETSISKFKRLRVLRLRKFSGNKLPESISSLRHLRFLDLSYTRIKSLPNSVCGLLCLEVLDLTYCMELEKLPVGLGKLIRLKTLVVTTKEMCLPEKEFRCLTALQVLGIFGCVNMESLLSDDGMKCLSSLHTLLIGHCNSLVCLPTNGIRELHKLENFIIGGCGKLNLQSDDQHRYSEGQRESGLRKVSFMQMPMMETLPSWLLCGANALKEIVISGCPNLTALMPEPLLDDLKCLQGIAIDECPELKSLPIAMHRLTALKELWVSECPQLVGRCIREDWNKISHVPDIYIDDRKVVKLQTQDRSQQMLVRDADLSGSEADLSGRDGADLSGREGTIVERFSLGSEFSDSDQTSGPTLEMEGTIVATDRTENQSPLGSTDRDTDPILTLEISIDRRWASFLNLKLQIFHFSQRPNTYKGQRFKEVLFYSHDYLVSAGETVRSRGKQELVELSQEIFSKEASSSSSVLPTKISDISRWEDAVLGISEAEDEAPGKENVVQSEEVVVIKISSLPDNPSFPNLTILLFQKDKSVRKLADSFFSNMPSLQVLDLSETGLRSLPSSLFQLTALEALLLRDCNNLDNLQADIGDLRNIKALDLKRTELYNLPEEVNNLTKLEFLRVSFYGAYDPSEYSSLPPVLISQSTISNLQSLKALSIIVHPSDWRWKNQAEALTHEVSNLRNLTYLQFWFTEVRLVKLFMEISPSWEKNTLCKFKFIVGQDIDRIVWRVPEKVVSEFDKHDRCLRYVNGNEIPAGFASLLVRVTAFYLDHYCVMKNLSEFGHDSFMGLEFCVVRECPEVVEIINNSEGSDIVVLPNIQHLSLHYLWNLENLWKGSVPRGSLSCLKFLSVHACHKLQALFTRPLLRCLNNLKELVVEDCALLKVIIAREEDHEMVQGRDLFFPYMTKINLHYLPELTNVWLGDCPLLESTGISIIGCPRVAQHSGSSGEIVELNTT